MFPQLNHTLLVIRELSFVFFKQIRLCIFWFTHLNLLLLLNISPWELRELTGGISLSKMSSAKLEQHRSGVVEGLSWKQKAHLLRLLACYKRERLTLFFWRSSSLLTHSACLLASSTDSPPFSPDASAFHGRSSFGLLIQTHRGHYPEFQDFDCICQIFSPQRALLHPPTPDCGQPL